MVPALKLDGFETPTYSRTIIEQFGFPFMHTISGKGKLAGWGGGENMCLVLLYLLYAT